jgi:hypothetical protein
LSGKSVFSSLSKLSSRAFTETAYQVLILLRHRMRLDRSTANQLLQPVRVNGLIKTSSSLRQSLNDSVKQIEKAEGQALESIPDAKLLKYQRELNELLFKKARTESGSVGASGKVVLDRLRSDAAATGVDKRYSLSNGPKKDNSLSQTSPDDAPLIDNRTWISSKHSSKMSGKSNATYASARKSKGSFVAKKSASAKAAGKSALTAKRKTTAKKTATVGRKASSR